MILALSGKAGSGKDLTARIIQYLLTESINKFYTIEQYLEEYHKVEYRLYEWQIKKFAHAVNKCYEVITGIDYLSLDREEKEKHRGNFRDFANKTKEVFGEDVWVNALMRQYVRELNNGYVGDIKGWVGNYPNWIISDLRFPNEARAIKDRDDLLIGIVRPSVTSKDNHISETALNNFQFDYVIDNSETIDELIVKIKEMLIHFNLL